MMTRFSWEPLAKYLSTIESKQERRETHEAFNHRCSVRYAARYLGVHEREVWRWMAGDVLISLAKAEAICSHIGVHGIEIWGDEWLAPAEDWLDDDLLERVIEGEISDPSARSMQWKRNKKAKKKAVA